MEWPPCSRRISRALPLRIVVDGYQRQGMTLPEFASRLFERVEIVAQVQAPALDEAGEYLHR